MRRGWLVFGDTVRDFVAPASRQGHLQRVLAALVAAQPQGSTSYAAPLLHLQSFLRRRGMVGGPAPTFTRPAGRISSGPSRRCGSMATKWSCSRSLIRRSCGRGSMAPRCWSIWRSLRVAEYPEH